MSRVREYQQAYEKALTNLKNNSNTLAVIVYGSIVTGDIWEESDIDFIVVTSEEDKMDILYTKEHGIFMHINYMSKDLFIRNYQNIIKGGTFHKAFSSGKLAYCIDKDVKSIYQATRFYSDSDRCIRNIDILCEIFNLMHYAKKFYYTKKYETSYELALLVYKNYARLEMNMSGYVTDKDVISIAVNLDSNIEELFSILVGNESLDYRINRVLEHVESFIEKNIGRITLPIVEFIQKNNNLCSIMDIQEGKGFNLINKDMSLVIHEMAKQGIINETTRKYETESGEFLVEELVYSV
ncbi:nucleotidyltransferase domain-containing protein [Clostridium sp.]|uniref:nucleotidyltransferase domain-containing protein n=1 Tax=Clostridium sp. TaxID=1506 RepID=UPI002FCA2D7C